MPVNWHGFSGGVGRGAAGAAPVFVDYAAQAEARQSVATPSPLTTFGRKCGTYAIGGVSRGGSCPPRRLKVERQVRVEAMSASDCDVGGAQRR